MAVSRGPGTPAPGAPPPLFGRGGPGAFVGKIERANDTGGTIARIWGYLRRQRLALALTALLVVGSTAVNLVGPYLLGQAIDRYILRHDLTGLAGLLWLMLG